MNNILKTTTSFGILLAALFVEPVTFAQTTINWANAALVQPTVASTATSPNLTISGGTWAVGDIIRFTGTTTALNPFSTAATMYYVVSVSGSTIQVSATPGGTALNAVTTTTASTTIQAQDWLTGGNWTGGSAPNANTQIANLAGNDPANIPAFVIGPGAGATIYGLAQSFTGSSDPTIVSGANGTGGWPLTFATSDSTTPKLTLTSINRVYFLGVAGFKLFIAGNQGLVFKSAPGSALVGSGVTATEATDPAKNVRIQNVDWSGFSGGLQIEEGIVQNSQGATVFPNQTFTVGNAQTITDNFLAGLNLNAQATSVDGLNGNSLGRIYGAATLTIGAANGSGNYAGVIGKNFQGTATATGLTKTGSGTETISGIVAGTGAVTVNGAGGTLILSSANTYSGTTTVTAGKLVVSSAQTGTGAFSVANGATLDVSVSGASQLSPTSLTMASTATTLEFINPASTTTAPLKPGTLNLNGTVTVNINNGAFSPGNSYPLVNWTTIAGAGGFVLENFPFTANLSTNSTTLVLNIPAATTNVWTGVSNGNWDTTTTGNWTGGTSIYADGGVAVFDDTATGATNVTVNQLLVKPGIALFNNSNLTYSVTSGSTNYIGGSGGLSVNGGGMVTLAGPNTYSGGTTLSAGQLNINYGGSNSTNSAIGTGTFSIGGGVIDNTSAGDVALAPTITQNWNGDFTYAGSAHNLNLGSGAVTLGTNRQVTVVANTLAVGGAIGDTGFGYSLTKTGNGTLVLAGGNTFSGGTIISNGTVQAGSSTALGGGPSQLYGGTLDLNGFSLANSNNINTSVFTLTNSSASAGALAGNSTVNSSFTIGVGTGNISVARLIDIGAPLTVTKIGNGTLTFNGAGHNNLMGVIVNAGTAVFANVGGHSSDRGTTLNSGTIKLNAVGSGSGVNADLINDTQPITINGGTFDLNGFNETVSTIGGTGGVILNNATGTNRTLTIGPDNGATVFSASYSGTIQNGTGVLALTKVGSGIQTLSGLNTYTGGTIITNTGTLQAGTNNVFPTAGGDMTVAGGTLDLNTFDNAINGLNGAGAVDTVAGGTPTLTVGVNGDSGNFTGTIQNSSGTLSLTKIGAGVQTLAGANNYSGSTTISNGTLTIGSPLSGAGAVTVNAPGVLNASNSPSVTGAVTLGNGGATLSLLDGAIDTLSLNGGLTLNSGNILKFDIGSAGLDQIIVSGAFTQSGTATININAVNAANAGTYPLISNAPGISTNNFVLGNSLSGYAFSLASDGSNLYLVVALNAPASAYWHNNTGTAWNGHTGSVFNWDTDQSSGINAGTVPAASSDVFFAADGATSFNTTLGADFILKSLNFNVANNVTIGGPNSLTLNGAITVNSGAGSNTISAASVVLGVDQNISVADTANTLTISSPISGAHAFNVSGSGTVSLSGSNSFTGGTIINSGTLALNNPTNTLPDTGAVNVNGGTLSIGNNNDTVGAVTLASGNITGSSGVLKGSSYNVQNGTVSANLGGTAAMTMTGSSVLLASNSTYSGGTTISSGTLQLGASNALGSGSATITAGTTLDLNGQTIPNVINYTGAGTATIVNNGVSAAAVTTDANVASTVTVDTTGGNITLARMVSTSVPRTLTKTGPDTLTFNGAGHNNLIKLVVQGGTVICANNGGFSADRGFELDLGTVILNGPGAGSGTNADLFNNTQQFWLLGGTFDLNGFNETVATVYAAGGSVIQNSAAGTNSTLTLGADNGTNLDTISGNVQDAGGVLAISKTGSGLQIINGSSTYSGLTTIANGQLQVTASGASPNSTFVVNTNGGLLFSTDTAFLIGGLSGAGNVGLVNDGSSPINLAVGANNASTTYSGVLSDGGAGATLTKVGNGALTLSGANTYTGLTTASNGVLVISPNYVANGNFTVNEGAVFGVSANTPVTSAQIGTLTMGISGSGSSTILFTSLPNPANAPMTVATLSPAGGAGSAIISNTAALVVGTYNLINYTNLTGAGFSAFALAPLPPGVVAHLVNNTAAIPNQIQLVVTAVSPEIWSGAVNTNWDINTTANWTLNGVATNYFDASPVLFDDTVGSGQTTVSLAANVQPSSVTVSNNAKNYTFTTSTGKGINGSTALTKNGNGILTLINLTNNFNGGAAINAGTMVLSSSTLGSGGIADNGNLVFSNGTTPVSVAISGSGTLTQNGTNTLELSGTNNTYSGGTTIKSGTIQSDNPNAIGTGTVALGDGASANNAMLQASPSSNFTNVNPITVASGGSGTYVIQTISALDYNLSGNIALNNALTLRTTANGALFVRGAITSGSSNPNLTIDGGGTTTKFVQLTADNSSTFTGNVIVTNGGDFKLGLANSLNSANTIALDSTATFDNGSLNQIIAGLNNFGSGGGTVADAGGAGVFLTLGGSGSYSFSGVINNSGSIVKVGSGQQTLSGANTYTGVTVVSNGVLVINGSLAGGAVTVAGGTLAGSGVLNGATTVQTGGTLSPGTSGIGTLTITNALTLQSGGTLAMDINKTGGTQDQIVGLTTVTYGGTLAVNNLSGSLTTTDSFKLFSAGSYAGAFVSISPVTPGAGLLWDTNTLTTDGTLRITTSAVKLPPAITHFSISGTTLTIQGTNGLASGQYILLSSTNVALPLSQWTPLLTNAFDGTGDFNLTTNFNAVPVRQFFILSQ